MNKDNNFYVGRKVIFKIKNEKYFGYIDSIVDNNYKIQPDKMHLNSLEPFLNDEDLIVLSVDDHIEIYKKTYLALGNMVWGRGFTIDEAMKNAKIKKKDSYYLFLSEDPSIYVDSLGAIVSHNKSNNNRVVSSYQRIAVYKDGKSVPISE